MGKYRRKSSKRVRKAYLKHYKSAGVDKFLLRDNSTQITNGVYRAHDHVKSMGIPDDGIRNRKDYHEVPPTKGISEVMPDIPTTLHRLWQAENGGQGIDRFVCEIILNGMFRQVRMYFCADIHFFVEIKQGIMKRSITYRDRQTALRQWGYGKVCWVEEQLPDT